MDFAHLPDGFLHVELEMVAFPLNQLESEFSYRAGRGGDHGTCGIRPTAFPSPMSTPDVRGRFLVEWEIWRMVGSGA
jgi:hypothetical protein